MNETRSPFVLGKPIKDPRDFYGREHELRELFESILHMQPVAMVGEHRCGNTSILYQMLHEDVQRRYVDEASREQLLLVFVSAQLSAEGPEFFYRRIARALRRVDPDAAVDFEVRIDSAWIEDYLERLVWRDRRLVLLLDEFEVLADFEASFWEWFRGLITEYDMSIVVATRVELGQFRAEWGVGSPFFNMFRSIYVGSFEPSVVDGFLDATAAATGLDWAPVRQAILDLAGRFPYFLQVAAGLFHRLAASEPLSGSPEQIARVAREFAARTELHFEHTWSRLPDPERDALAWLAVGAKPGDREILVYRQSLPVLERRGYAVDGRIFSAAFADYVRRQIQRIELSPESGEVRLEKRAVELPPKEYALLRFFMEREGEVVTKDEIAAAVWPEYQLDTVGVTDAMIQKTISRLRKEIDAGDAGFQHIESVRGQGYRFQNASLYEFHHEFGGVSRHETGGE